MNNDVPSPINLRQKDDAIQWAEEANVKRPYRLTLFSQIVACIKLQGAHSVLELGSGPGYFAQILLTTLSSIHYTALDFSQPMHQLAKERLGPLAKRARFIHESFLNQNWVQQVQPIEAVVSIQAVHETRHKSKALPLFKQIRQVLVPDGIFYYCGLI